MQKDKKTSRHAARSREKRSNAKTAARAKRAFLVERVQAGVRIEKSLSKVLKGLAEYLDMTLGDLLDSVVLHSFEGKRPFQKKTMARIEILRGLYELETAYLMGDTICAN